MVQLFKVSYSVFKTAAQNYEVFHFSTPAGDGYVLGSGHSEVVYTTTITDNDDVTDFIDNLLVTSIEAEIEGDVIARPTLSTTGNLQTRFDFLDSTIYVGKAKQNISDSSVGWTIQKFVLVDGNVVSKQTTNVASAVWDDRTIEAYN